MINRAYLEALAESDLLGDVWFSIDRDDRRSIIDLALSAHPLRPRQDEKSGAGSTGGDTMTDIPPMTAEELDDAREYHRLGVDLVCVCGGGPPCLMGQMLATIDAKDAEIAKEVYDRNAAEDVIEELRAEIDALTLTDALQAKVRTGGAVSCIAVHLASYTWAWAEGS